MLVNRLLVQRTGNPLTGSATWRSLAQPVTGEKEIGNFVCIGKCSHPTYIYPFHPTWFQGLPQELNRNHEIIKLVTQSLLKCHKMAVNAAEDGHLSAKTIVDGRWGYTHSEVSLNTICFYAYANTHTDKYTVDTKFFRCEIKFIKMYQQLY